MIHSGKTVAIFQDRIMIPKGVELNRRRFIVREGWNELTIYLSRVLCLSSCLSSCRPVVLSYSCHSCGTLSYSLCHSNQTDRVVETEGFEREGLEVER